MDVKKKDNSTNNEELVEANSSPNKTSVECPNKIASVDSGLELDPSPACSKETVQPDATVLVTFGSEKYNIPVVLNGNVADFKTKVAELSGVPENMQKLICKGVKLVEEKTLKECGVGDNSKIMLIGSRPAEVDNVKKGGTPSNLAEIKASEVAKKEPLCRQKQHMKVLEKGVPEDAIPGIRNAQDPLPNVPISGMLNKSGGKVRLTFKLELDQVWIGTKERTEKLNMTQIKRIINEPIESHEEYHILRHKKTQEMSFVYFFKVVDILETSPELKKTFLGIAKQMSFTAGGCVVGGVVGGPFGAFFGSLIGALLGYWSGDEYDSLVHVIKHLSDEEKCRLELKVQALVGSSLVEDLIKFVQQEINRQLLLTVISDEFKPKEKPLTTDYPKGATNFVK